LYFYFSKLLAPFINLTNFLILLIILIIFFRNYSSKKKFRLFAYLVILSFLSISILPIGNIGLNSLENRYINQQQILEIDNIIVLAGSEDIQSTKITKKLNLNSGSERLIASIKLANEFNNAKIIFLGGDGNLVKNSIDETFVAKKFFKDVNFDINRIHFINNTRNTYENLKEFKKIGDSNKNVLITSAYHMKRSLLIANKLNIELIPYAVDFRADNNASIINFYQRFSVSKNLSSFDIFFREIMGILAFRLFY
tara:strand:+ start:49 stop:810 length:762 start_codon:yes stop_codon:yes gene_type:complete